jgi:hypothetical protein
VRRAVAENHNAPEDVVRKAAEDEDVWVRQAAERQLGIVA